MIRRPPRSTQELSSAASDVYKRQLQSCAQTLWLDFPCVQHCKTQRNTVNTSEPSDFEFARFQCTQINTVSEWWLKCARTGGRLKRFTWYVISCLQAYKWDSELLVVSKIIVTIICSTACCSNHYNSKIDPHETVIADVFRICCTCTTKSISN